MAKQINIGDNIDLGKVGYVSLPDGAVVTSGATYTVRHEGKHVAFGTETVEYDVVDPNKPRKSKADEPEVMLPTNPPKHPAGPPAPPSA
ncbi:hypothetical protein [Kribbella italica]|uniref:Uncharacterized protein n=1 Tax=Kribbella italica TaxID=1540520 RepID=A0A7W9JBF3_9ACTN|nr:hypothetical protein [Kribbella italica]MBB5838707.1 hypothetical protein [Kribbella italica]